MIDNHLKVPIATIVKALESQIEFVKAGIGMALMPSGIERFCKPGDEVFYSFLAPLSKRAVVVMWRKDQKMLNTKEG